MRLIECMWVTGCYGRWARKAAHAERGNSMVGPDVFLESRIATRCSGHATSTQLPLLPVKLLVRHTMGSREVIVIFSIRMQLDREPGDELSRLSHTERIGLQ